MDAPQPARTTASGKPLMIGAAVIILAGAAYYFTRGNEPKYAGTLDIRWTQTQQQLTGWVLNSGKTDISGLKVVINAENQSVDDNFKQLATQKAGLFDKPVNPKDVRKDKGTTPDPDQPQVDLPSGWRTVVRFDRPSFQKFPPNVVFTNKDGEAIKFNSTTIDEDK